MAPTIVLLIAIWAVTVPVVLGLARVLGRWSGPRALEAAEVEAATRPAGSVVPLVARPRNALAPRPAESLREVS